MKLCQFVFIITLPFLASCEYAYEFGGEFTPTIVVNSTITPDSTIKVYLHWSKHIEDTTTNKKVERFTAKIYEDNNTIFDGEGINGLLSTAHHPQEGSQYRLEIDVLDYGRLSAETSIPPAPKIKLEYTGVQGNPLVSYGGGYRHFNLDKIELGTTTRSVMIRSYGLYKERESELARELYVDNPFCDQFNTIIDMSEVALRGSSVGYEYYIRVPYKNIEQSMPLKFAMSNFPSYSEYIIIGEDEFGHSIYEKKEEWCSHMRVEVIAPSDEYDKFYKSAYLQKSLDNAGIFSETFLVHSNIENGLGSFMGYSSTTVIYEVEYDE